MHLYQTRRGLRNKDLLLSIIVFVALIVLFSYALGGAMRQNEENQQQTLREAIVRAAVTCYAVEGRYPESLDYLCEHYGVIIDEARFAVRYDVFASNLMPDVSVTLLGGRQ